MTTTRFVNPIVDPGPSTTPVPLPTWPPVSASPSTVNQSLRQVRLHGAVAAGNVIPIVYGRQRVEGRIFYWQPELPTGRPLHVGVLICHGELEEITNVRINGSVVQSGLNGITFATYLGTAAGNSDANVVAYYGPGATVVNPKFPGIAWARFSLDLFNVPWESIESFSFDVKGKKVKDPRTGLTAYSANAALCAYDFMTSFRGCRIPESSMDSSGASSSWCVAADRCDETVDSEKRYELNLVISDPQEADSILEGIRTHFQADIFSMKGKVRCVVEGARASVLDFSETGASMNLRNVRVSTVPAADRPAVVNVTFPNAAKEYADDTVKFPQTAAPAGQAAEAAYTLPGCTSEKQAMRIAKILQRKAAFEKYAFEGIGGPEAVRLTRRDVVRFTTRDGLALQTVDVLDLEPLESGEYQIRGREHDSAAYSDEAHVVDTMVTTSFPPPLGAPTSVPYVRNAEGWSYLSAFSRKVYWLPPRYFKAPTHYPTAFWTNPGGTALVAGTKVNDGSYADIAVDWDVGSNGDGLILDVGQLDASNAKAFNRCVITVGTGDTHVTHDAFRFWYSDDEVAWTEITMEEGFSLGFAVDDDGVAYRHITFEWDTPTAHRYWRIDGALVGGLGPQAREIQFYDAQWEEDPRVTFYEVVNVLDGTLAVTIPGYLIPTASQPLDVSPWIRVTPLSGDYSDFEYHLAVVPVTRYGQRGPSVPIRRHTTGTGGTGDADGAAAYVMRQSGATGGTAQSGSLSLDGEAKAADLHATTRVILDSAPSAGVSAAGQIALRDNAGALEASINGAAYAAVGGGGPLTVEEIDGTPSVANVTKIKVSNGTLTDNGGGTVTVTTGGGGGGGFSLVSDVFSGDGATTGFTLSAALATGDKDSCPGVYIDGALQTPSAYTATTSTLITFGTAPSNGSNIIIVFFATAPTGVTGVSATVDTGDGSTTDFTLDQTALANGLLGGYVDGALQAGTILISGGAAIRYATAPADGANVVSVVLY